MTCFKYSFLFLLPFLSFSQQTKIAFGSCSDQNDSLPIFRHILEKKPDYYVFLGDNIYGDTYIPDTLKARYERLKKNRYVSQIFSTCKVYATWDDHDYGWNDVGKYYECKTESRDLFWDFLNTPKNAPIRKQYGIYHSELQKIGNKTLQFIVLDERTFRSDLRHFNEESDTLFLQNKAVFYRPDYTPITETDSTILGNEQWSWLEKQLNVPADLRIICSGTQFGITYNGYESWANFPKEQEKMLELIKTCKANGVIFISGDVHYSEISKLNYDGLYPIYDITSSGISETWLFATPNLNRIEGPVMDNNFGLLTVDWSLIDPLIKMELWDKSNNQRVEYSIPLSSLQF